MAQCSRSHSTVLTCTTRSTGRHGTHSSLRSRGRVRISQCARPCSPVQASERSAPVPTCACGAGGDLRVPMPAPPKPDGAPDRAQGDVARGIATGWQRVVTAVLDCEKVVIAALNGTAAGAGMHLALACDVVVMAESAKLVPVFIRRGIAPDAGGAYLLTRLVGPHVAKRLY